VSIFTLEKLDSEEFKPDLQDIKMQTIPNNSSFFIFLIWMLNYIKLLMAQKLVITLKEILTLIYTL
jgi:hypothetical protein